MRGRLNFLRVSKSLTFGTGIKFGSEGNSSKSIQFPVFVSIAPLTSDPITTMYSSLCIAAQIPEVGRGRVSLDSVHWFLLTS